MRPAEGLVGDPEVSALKNPKDTAGSCKPRLSLVPVTAIAVEATAFANGMWKYGLVNWRNTPVSATIYIDALLRHAFAYANGEECDPEDGVRNLAAVRACAGILIDAEANGTLIDDRAQAGDFRPTFDAAKATTEHLQKLHSHRNPTHFHITGPKKRDEEVGVVVEELRPCRSPYCECVVGQCSHPGCYDARCDGVTTPAVEQFEGIDLRTDTLPDTAEGIQAEMKRRSCEHKWVFSGGSIEGQKQYRCRLCGDHQWR